MNILNIDMLNLSYLPAGRTIKHHGGNKMLIKSSITLGMGLLLALMMLLTTGCPQLDQGTPPDPIDYANAVITLERTPCYGPCPVYDVTIYGDGTVVYEGYSNVAVTGTQTTQISPNDVKNLVDEFFAIDFFSLEDEYTANITDLPETYTSITVNGETKRIRDYSGAPWELMNLEHTIDLVAGTAQWVVG